MLSVGTVWADLFEDGNAARERGDFSEAVNWYRLAAAQGHIGAQIQLGWMYKNGFGVPKDDVKGVECQYCSVRYF